MRKQKFMLGRFYVHKQSWLLRYFRTDGMNNHATTAFIASVVKLLCSSVHCAFIKENILPTLALCLGMRKKNYAILSSSEWQSALQLF
jgi:hypothetical protein